MSHPDYKVGDQLALRGGRFGGITWSIYDITSVSPTGRLTLADGAFVLNPDLSVRGVVGYHGPFRAEPVTDKVRSAIALQDARRRYRILRDEIQPGSLSLDEANALSELLCEVLLRQRQAKRLNKSN